MYRQDVQTMSPTAKQQALLNIVSADQLELDELRILMMGPGIGKARVAQYLRKAFLERNEENDRVSTYCLSEIFANPESTIFLCFTSSVCNEQLFQAEVMSSARFTATIHVNFLSRHRKDRTEILCECPCLLNICRCTCASTIKV